ncbi:gephyrin-like molybdotransferase receptor GlpR [Gordonia polyisoprenivorans]|uniref:divisome protein SepX/GlpR n=1 Tax=Gordonia polyisoprenivorans TaxID=84595 RepID=UPI000373C7BE|nr:gephyrin-like molybdotransferase receptor GlpR [Gordonia polyisoprenivorans]
MPNSVLWVCLVAVWLFVLVPMVIKGRPQTKKTTEVAKATRLLHRGGTRTRSTRRRRAAGAHPHDPSYVAERATARRSATAVLDAEDDDTADDDTEDRTAEADSSVDSDADEVLTGDVETDDVEDTEDAVAEKVTITRVEVDVVEVEVDLLDEDDDAELDDESQYEDAELDDEYDDDENAEFDDDYDEVAEYDDEDADYEDDLDGDYEDSEYDEYDDEDYDDEVDLEDEVDEELEGLRKRREATPAAAKESVPEVKQDRKSRRRSAYTIDATGDALRYKERQRVTLALAAMVIAAIVCGVLFGQYGWIATGVTGVLFVGYLFYLRRTVKAEQQIRAQRIARARRAAKADAERERREMQTPEFAAAPPPPRLRRPGGAVVLEIDDEDPVFDHLPPFQRRRVMREDEDFRQAAAG